MTRLHDAAVEVSAKRDGDRATLLAPQPGYFTPALTDGDLVARGHTLGDLEVLGRRIRLVAPDVHGLAASTKGPRAVAFGDPLLEVDAAAQLGGHAGATASETTAAATGLVFRAPTSGRFYSKAAPDKPVFVKAGDELAPGATVCLLEVMKTFHRVTYGGAGVPERARVREVLVADGADVTQGDPLLALDPIST